MSNDFEIIAYERNSIRSEDEKIEERCKDMQSELDSMSQMLSNRELTDSFFQRLENIRTTKQDILSNDKEIEEENNLLWVTARDIKGKMEENSKKHSLLDEDNLEIQKLFKDITGERNVLIEKDNMLNIKYQLIYEDLRKVCDERVEIKEQVEQVEGDDKDSLMQKDLNLAVAQKELENNFDGWKTEKNELIQDNKTLDGLLDSLMSKFELLKEKKQILVDEDLHLENQSQELKLKFESNQRRKEEAIELFKEQEMLTDEIMKEFEESKKESEQQEIEHSDVKPILEEFDRFKQMKESLKKRDEEITETYNLAKSELDDLLEENDILSKHLLETEAAYERFKQIFEELEAEQGKEMKSNSIGNSEEKIRLHKEKEELNKRDECVAEKFEKYDLEIEAIQSTMQDLASRQEEIEWETCLLGNELDEQ